MTCVGNDRLVGFNVTAGPPLTPVPFRLAVCGLPIALSVTVTVPVIAPALVGANFTVRMQLCPAFTPEPQFWLSVNCALAVMLLILNGPVPVLVRVICCPGLVVPTCCGAKVKLLGVSDTVVAAAETPRSIINRPQMQITSLSSFITASY